MSSALKEVASLGLHFLERKLFKNKKSYISLLLCNFEISVLRAVVKKKPAQKYLVGKQVS